MCLAGTRRRSGVPPEQTRQQSEWITHAAADDGRRCSRREYISLIIYVYNNCIYINLISYYVLAIKSAFLTPNFLFFFNAVHILHHKIVYTHIHLYTFYTYSSNKYSRLLCCYYRPYYYCLQILYFCTHLWFPERSGRSWFGRYNSQQKISGETCFLFVSRRR